MLSTHVDETLDILRKAREREWTLELTIVIGSALFGACDFHVSFGVGENAQSTCESSDSRAAQKDP